MVLLVGLMISLGKYIPKSERLGKLVLSPALSSDAGFTAAETRSELIGNTGVAVTALRPSGSVLIGEQRIAVVTSGEYIASGSSVRVVSVRGSRVEVRSLETPRSPDATSV